MQSIPPEKFDANSLGNIKQDEPLRKQRVRRIDLPIGRLCPERAEAYGLDYELWRTNYDAALASNLEEIQKAGEEWRLKLKGQTKVRITSDAGTDLTLRTKPLEPMIEDGIISERDRKRGFVSTSLPAGKIICAAQPTSARGEVHFTEPVFIMGRSVNGLRLRFDKGRLIHWEADEHAELLTSLLRRGKATGDQMGWFSVGLNSAAEPRMLDNSIVENDIGIGLGPHLLLEPSRIVSKSYFDGTIGLGSIEVLD
jgi:hypothetical protein